MKSKANNAICVEGAWRKWSTGVSLCRSAGVHFFPSFAVDHSNLTTLTYALPLICLDIFNTTNDFDTFVEQVCANGALDMLMHLSPPFTCVELYYVKGKGQSRLTSARFMCSIIPPWKWHPLSLFSWRMPCLAVWWLPLNWRSLPQTLTQWSPSPGLGPTKLSPVCRACSWHSFLDSVVLLFIAQSFCIMARGKKTLCPFGCWFCLSILTFSCWWVFTFLQFFTIYIKMFCVSIQELGAKKIHLLIMPFCVICFTVIFGQVRLSLISSWGDQTVFKRFPNPVLGNHSLIGNLVCVNVFREQ